MCETYMPISVDTELALFWDVMRYSLVHRKRRCFRLEELCLEDCGSISSVRSIRFFRTPWLHTEGDKRQCYRRVSNIVSAYHGVSNIISAYCLVSNIVSGYRRISNIISAYHGVSNIVSAYHRVSKIVRAYHGVSNNVSAQRGFLNIVSPKVY